MREKSQGHREKEIDFWETLLTYLYLGGTYQKNLLLFFFLMGSFIEMLANLCLGIVC